MPLSEFSLNYLSEYLQSLGIEKIQSFIGSPAPEDEEPWQNLDGIFDVIEILHESFEKGKKFFLQVDSDADGYTSAAIFYSFFKRLYPDANIEFRLHDGKEHGVILGTVPTDADIIVLPDSGSMQFDEQEELSRLGRTVVILDHHHVENPPRFENVYIVNNQISPKFNNKFLSGAGIVYKVIQGFNQVYANKFPEIYDQYTDLAALGIISDMMDTRTLDNNFLIQKGLSNVLNPMFRAILEKQQFSIERSGADIDFPNKITIAFYVAPLINAVIRFGTDEEKLELFRGFIETDTVQIVETEYRGETRRENFYDYVARIATNVRARQNREKTKSMEFLSKRIEKDNLHANQLLIVTVSKDDEVPLPQTITGLVAMELLKKYKKPTLVLRPRNFNGELFYAGSGRAKSNGDFTSLMEVLKESGYCEYVEGHDMAHGVSIKADNLQKVIDFANKKLANVEFDVAEVEVDYAFTNSNLNREMLEQFGEAMHLYGNGIPQPKFGFTLNVGSSAIRTMGKNQNTVRISVGGVDFLMFNATDLVEKLKVSNSPMYKFTIIGRAQINEWNGKKTPQIMVDEVDFEPIMLADLF